MAAKDIRLEIDRIVKADLKSHQNVFINERVMNKCWHEIWRWISVSSIGPYLLKYGVAGDITELSSYINNSYFSSRQKADHLLTLASQCGPNGYHVLYMCIREDDENPLGHASVIDVLVRTAKQLESKSSDLARNNSVQTTQDPSIEEEDGPQGQVLPSKVSVVKETAKLQKLELNIQTPSQETCQANTTPSNTCTSKGTSKEYTPTCQTNKLLHNPTTVDGRVVSPPTPITTPPTTISDAAFQSFPSVPGRSDMSDVTTTFTDTTTTSVDSSAIASPYLSPCEQIDNWSDSDIIMSKVQNLLKDFNEKNVLESGLDIQMSGRDDFTALEDLLEELIRFVVSCLNNRQSGILIVGIDYTSTGEYMLTGVPSFNKDVLDQLLVLLEYAIDNRVQIRASDGTQTRSVEKGLIQRMIKSQIIQASSPDSNIFIFVVVPDLKCCKEFLYQLLDQQEKHIVLSRLDGHITQLKGPQIIKLQNKIHEDYVKKN